MYALVEIKGRQYKARKGRTLKVDRIAGDKGDTLEFDSVLMIRDDEEGVKIGTPYVEGAKIKTVLEDHGKDKKVVVYKYKRRKRYHKKQGHRQQFSLIRVDDIVGA